MAAMIASLLAVTMPLSAATATVHRSDMKCEEFLTLDNVTRPKIIYWAEGVKAAGKHKDAIIDVTSIDQLVPIVVEQCRCLAERAAAGNGSRFWLGEVGTPLSRRLSKPSASRHCVDGLISRLRTAALIAN